MPEPVGAAGQLGRILEILPRASREGGISLAELSDTMGVGPELILRDLTQVTARAYYLPPGEGDLLLEIDGNRVNLETRGIFHRPVRLSMPEAVCLGLALRGRLAAGRGAKSGSGSEPDAESGPGSEAEADTKPEANPGGEPATLRLLHSLETTISAIPTEDALARIEAADLRPDPAGIREILNLALESREECRIQYLKSGAEAPEDRTVRPYALAHGEGHWYLLAWCNLSEGIRTFRLDRVLDAEPTGESFPAPEDFDPEVHIQGGRVFRADQRMNVTVRYSPQVARWIAEKEAAEPASDGSLTVTYEVADPHWIVRHVLRYGPGAEVLEPEEVREWVRGLVNRWEEVQDPKARAVGR
ncbi:MAG: WYL domain-containing protein [Gemmatimonadota bacterium]|jgi:proteasome accessory factor C